MWLYAKDILPDWPTPNVIDLLICSLPSSTWHMNDEDIEPVNPDEEGLLYIGDIRFPDLESNADVITEIINADPNKLFGLHWRNATVTMRAGSWTAIFQSALLRR